jgi:hypothetical protein
MIPVAGDLLTKFSLAETLGEDCNGSLDGVGVEIEVGDQSQGATCVRYDEYVFGM